MNEEPKKILKAIYGSPDRPLKIGDIEIPCYVLEGGTRVLSQRGLQTSIGMSTSGGSAGAHRMARFVDRLQKKGIEIKDLVVRINDPIMFLPPGPRKGTYGKVAYGYEATILPDLCDFILACDAKGILLEAQKQYAEAAAALKRGLAAVGIVALVDAATGYEKVRPHDELMEILKLYISPIFLPWTKRFPDEFWERMYALRGWPYPPEARLRGGSPKGPRFAAKLVRKLIYEQLPDGVLEGLEKKFPHNDKWQRSGRFPQGLTSDIGNPHLEKQVAIVTTLMRISPNWRKFEANFAKAFPQPGDQGDLLDDLDDEGEDEDNK
jgi:hypothetical protein